MRQAENDPLLTLFNENWLASCGGLFRSATVSPDYFDDAAQYYEWTFFAFRLALERRIIFLDIPTFRVHDSPLSLSKTLAYSTAEVHVLRRMLRFAMPARARAALREKLSRAWHGLSDFHRQRGEMQPAWTCHARSLFYPGGLRYLSYTSRLFHRQIPMS